MPVQFLYPNKDIGWTTTPFAEDDIYRVNNSIYNIKTATTSLLSQNIMSSIRAWVKSTPTDASGYYTYIDEGTGTPNDNDYIYMSGSIGSGISFNYQPNIFGRFYTTFGLDDLQVKPSSVQLNFRGSYDPANSTHSGKLNIWAILHTSGHAANITNEGNFQTYCYGLNYNQIIASSIFSINSGNFATYSMNMMLNDLGINSFDRYSKSYLTLAVHQEGAGPWDTSDTYFTRFKVSAIDVVVSGEYNNYKGVGLHSIGGSSIVLQSDRLFLYHDYHVSDIPSRINPSDDDYVTNTRYNPYYNAESPNMCLGSGSFEKKSIFRDCFFDFDKSGIVLNGTSGRNNLVYDSNVSSHQFGFDVNSSYPVQLEGYAQIGQARGGRWNVSFEPCRSVDDSYLYIEPNLYGTCNNFLPSGDFSLWIGCDQVFLRSDFSTTPTKFIEGETFSFGRRGSNIYATCRSTDGDKTISVAPTDGVFLGFCVTYDSGGMSLYQMKVDGNIVRLGSTEPFTRRTVTAVPSGNIIFNYDGQFPNTITDNDAGDYSMYEFGVVGSGLSSNDLLKLNRKELFRQLDLNALVQPITSGHHYLQYKTYQYRAMMPYAPYSSYRFDYSGNSYYPAIDNYEFQTTPFYDVTLSNFNISPVNFSHRTNNVTTLHSDVALNCHMSGNRANYFQDGDIYFSGWIDCSTTNPSGLVNNNFIIRAYKDMSLQSNGNYLVNSPVSGILTAYDTLYQMRGKYAAQVITLRSGLNEYVIPLKRHTYYYDLFTDERPPVTYTGGTYSPAEAAVIDYDKGRIYHPDWNGADISLLYIGYQDNLSSGWYDNLRIHTAALISDYWTVPPTGIANGINLFIEGHAQYYSGCDLYLHNANTENGCDLFCFCENVTTFSGNQGVTLYTHNGSSVYGNGTTLFIDGPYPASSGIPLYTIGPVPYSGGIPLYINSNPLPSSISNIPLFLYSTTNSGVSKGLSLHTQSAGHTKPIPLFIKVQDETSFTGSIPLFMNTEGNLAGGLSMYLNNTASSVVARQRLFIRGAGNTEGASIYNSRIPLYIGAGVGEAERARIPLTLKAVDGTSSGTTMYVSGGTFVTKALPISMATTMGINSSGTTLYSHGF